MTSLERPTFAVIGQPVGHSLSPALFTWLFAREGVEASYVALEVSPAELEGVLGDVRRGRYQGLSVTMPHKQAVARLVDELDPVARRVGAVNCVARRGDTLLGLNTDVAGVREALRQGGALLEGTSALVLGAGGAARAAVVALLESGAARVWVANRTPAKAAALAAEVEDARVAPLSSEVKLPEVLAEARVLVNATPAGLPGCQLHADLTVLDMVYRPLRTPLLVEASSAGALALDGLWMLVHQGLEAFRAWSGPVDPAVAAALHAHLVEASRPALAELREGIRRVDRELLELLHVRMSLAKKIGSHKQRLGEPVRRPERERELLAAHRHAASELGLSEAFVEELFQFIFAESRRLQGERRERGEEAGEPS